SGREPSQSLPVTCATFFAISMRDFPVPPSPENSPACLSGTRPLIAHWRSGVGSESQFDISSHGSRGGGASGDEAGGGSSPGGDQGPITILSFIVRPLRICRRRRCRACLW